MMQRGNDGLSEEKSMKKFANHSCNSMIVQRHVAAKGGGFHPKIAHGRLGHQTSAHPRKTLANKVRAL